MENSRRGITASTPIKLSSQGRGGRGRGLSIRLPRGGLLQGRGSGTRIAASQDRKGPSVSTARTLLCKAASEPRKEATQQDENHGIEVVDVSGLGDGQALEQAGSKSQARDEVPIESGGEDEATSPHPLAWSLAGVQEPREGLGPVTKVQERHTRVRAGVTTRAAARAAAAKPGRGIGELKSAPPRTSKNRGEQDDALLSCRLNMEASLEVCPQMLVGPDKQAQSFTPSFTSSFLKCEAPIQSTAPSDKALHGLETGWR
ncbi:hypothetical protein SELMODRAFT_425736 [Selaginella moellendorffii]|uniref:Uncharacterized protein n=1 Tax=Selaginella moellendorffii TaxID=88036 RepID=D8SU40_SELML|nr:hypothetical protein SELMODRAFT_425736 [Selaginella moellendorffii]